MPEWEAEHYCSSVYVACRDGNSANSIAFLAYKWPDLISTIDSYGQVPLNYAAQVRAYLSTIHLLVESWPGVVRVKDNQASYHCIFLAGVTALMKLFSFFMEACWNKLLQICTKYGQLPLHCGAEGRLSWSA